MKTEKIIAKLKKLTKEKETLNAYMSVFNGNFDDEFRVFKIERKITKLIRKL